MWCRGCTSGFTLVEVMIAVLLLALVSLAVTSTLIASQRALVHSAQWMQAIQLAAAGIEQLRAGQPLTSTPSGFERSSGVTPWPGHRGLYRVEVTVVWAAGEPHRFQLATLVRR